MKQKKETKIRKHSDILLRFFIKKQKKHVLVGYSRHDDHLFDIAR